MKTTNKLTIQSLVEICYSNGLRDIVFSPGSRNAPLVIAFNADSRFITYCIPDERVAGFYAMGISLKKGIPCMLCCTSGTAALNYAPAIAEAYYQEIPLLILTADRPENKIDQGVGQSMRQKHVYTNYIQGSYEISSSEDAYIVGQNNRIIFSAVIKAFEKKGPVHINIPLTEPLYTPAEKNVDISKLEQLSITDKMHFQLDPKLLKLWQTAKRKIVIVGQGKHHEDNEKILAQLSENGEIILMTETCANVYANNSIQCIDRVLTGVADNEASYRPDLLVYLGGQIISKKIIRYFTDNPAAHQWYIHPHRCQDTFESLSQYIQCESNDFLRSISNLVATNDITYNRSWHNLNTEVRAKHIAYLPEVPYSDLKVFDHILSKLPQNVNLHMSNSSSVRYVQLFDQREDVDYHANRGVSGIDGCTSTAMGYSKVSDRLNILITGDVSFLYDSNAFWHPHLPDNLKIILINNGGGGIFRIIDGPSSSEHLEQFFESHHTLEAEQFSKTYGLEYYRADDIGSLETAFKNFMESKSTPVQLMEVVTPRLDNSKVLKEYFDALLK